MAPRIQKPDFHALFDAVPGLYLVLTPAFTIVGASDEYLRATLTKREDILQHGLFEAFPDDPDNSAPDSSSNLRESLERVLRTGVPDTMAVQKYDMRHPATHGGLEERYWSSINSPVFGSDKHIEFILHRVEDVTDLVCLRKSGASPPLRGRQNADSAESIGPQVPLQMAQLEKADGSSTESQAQLATASEQGLRALFDLMPQLGWTARPDGFTDFYNRGWYEYTGTTYAQMEGWGWKTVHDPLILPLVMEHWQESLRLGTPFEMEFPLRRHDGFYRWFLVRVRPIKDLEGNVLRWIGIDTDIHEQREAAQSGEELHAAILNSMAEGVCLVRAADNVMVYTNRKFDLMLGYEAAELIGKPVALIHHQGKQSAERSVADIVAGLERAGEATYEVPRARKDGSLVWHRVRTSRLKHPSFGLVWVVVDEDISEGRNTAEERDSFFEMSADLLCIGSSDGYFKRINPAFERILGWTSDEMVERQLLDFVHPDDVKATTEAMSQGVLLESFENRYRCKDGSYRWLQWTGRPIVERNLFYAAARDVTENKAAKEALRELSESLETTLHSIGDGVIATDVGGMVVRMNPVAEALTGWALAEAKGRPFAQVFHIIDEDTRATLRDPVEAALRSDVTVDLPKRTLLLRKDGSEVAIADSCAPIRTADHTVSGAVLVFRDLVHERNAAAVHAKYQQQLVFSDRMASVGTLAAGVAHEINNPLTYIMANIDTVIEEIRLLSGGSSSGRLKDIEEVLLEARAGATRVAKIVRGLKTFSRIEEERLGVVDVIPVLELSVNMAFNEIRHRARLVKDYGKIPLVDADDARLGQVFINLLVNAAQAVPEGNSDANEIRIITSTDTNGNAVVEVRDTGPGMSPELLPRIFDPFFTTKPAGIGTGLGLAICHNIISGMGGEISVQSELGRGTTFRVMLPASKKRLAVVARPVTPSEEIPSHPARVLVVDDEPAVGFAVRRVLRHHDVTVVTKAQDALSLLATGKDFDLILSDLMMPGMSGMEFYAALSGLHPRMAARVVFVTGGAFTPEANAFLDRIPNDRIEKPFDFKQLRELVRNFVKAASPGVAAD